MKSTLRGIRSNKKMTQRQAGAQVGVSEKTWFNWENGKSYPNAPQVDEILKTFNVSYEDVIF